MRKSHWRLNPTPFEEQYIRQASLREGRTLSQMVHRLVFEAIMQRHSAERQTTEILEVLRGANVESAQ
jgi:hypothetical protein